MNTTNRREKQIPDFEDDYCPLHGGHLKPCRVCIFYSRLERADYLRKQKKEEALLHE